ncbi:TetR family transcriptional regulator [Leifsonia sp. LS1]|uniref:ScbR family autoregulator-binding transcription factor n=1 Tax=Leifsonia sp. LS1 TaxID=2828483 RepID=UPI001CFCE2A7|nr:ScbR family autoregulator-binding transcription factor [Leifsonia sp. LS1]GIT79816.1 TetR family transcriptional regulator [Leifsonia sp. LS1]
MPLQERAERSRTAILDAAAAEFDAHGYAGARLDRIIERTQLTKGAVYFHFRSKQDLAEALVAEKYATWPELVAEVDASGATGLAAAREVLRRVAVVFATDARVRAAMKLSRTVLTPEPDDDAYARWSAVVGRSLEQAAEAGELSPGADPSSLATVAVQAFFGAYLIADERGRLDGLEADAERIWDVIAGHA